jgi:proteasome lid subunit RPN8/RPN11
VRARARLDRRPAGEVFAGWFHSHPDFCSPDCPPAKRAVCPLRVPFLSEADLLLHAAVFPAAWSVALLVTDAGDARIPALYGWRDGIVRRRGFHITPD